MPQFIYLLFISLFSQVHNSVFGLAGDNADPAQIQSFLPNSSPSTTIPAFPEQSDLSTCPLDLPDALFSSVSRACPASGDDPLLRTRCCPTLAAWLYAAYSHTALRPRSGTQYDALPVLPDDSETCVDQLGKALQQKGLNLPRPNSTCDLVYCYCGIRLHALTCPDSFRVSNQGKLVGSRKVRQLEHDCKLAAGSSNSRAGCSKCLNTLNQLNDGSPDNRSSGAGDATVGRGGGGDRKSKMRNRDCQLMGLTWLLSKNRTAYISTITHILRAFMVSGSSSEPRSCSLVGDGLPLAVDSSELGDQSHSPTIHRLSSYYHHYYFLLLSLFIIHYLV